MAKYVYPAILREENGKVYVRVPDLAGCNTVEENFADAIEMARDAVEMWLCIAEDKREVVPAADLAIKTDVGMVTLIDADTDEYRRLTDNRAVKKTLTIPSWLNAKAEKAGINFSAVLRSALEEQLDVR